MRFIPGEAIPFRLTGFRPNGKELSMTLSHSTGRNVPAAPPAAAVPPNAAGRAAGATLAVQFALIWTTFFLLSSAIGWPASLDDPAAIALPRLLENEGAVLLGYGFYLAAALLLVPAAAALNARLGLTGPLAGFLLALAVMSAVAKAIGITRWLFAMPVLARLYVEPGADQGAVALVFEALNAYAGGIGEILGVGLLTGLWTALAGRALMRQGSRAATWAGGFAVVAGLGLFFTIPAGFGAEFGPVLTITNIVWQFALLGIGLWCLFARPATSR
jgi:hypothetical protein